MSQQVGSRNNPPPSPRRSAFLMGGALFVIGIAVGGWGAFKFFAQPPSAEPTFAAHQNTDKGEPAQAAKDETTKMNLGVTNRALHVKLDTVPKRPLRYKGPIQLTNAILINGGASAQSNYFSHHLHIRMLREVLRRRGLSNKKMTVFSTDGDNREPDQMISSSRPMSWLFSGLREEQLVSATRLVNTTLRGKRMYPAKRTILGRYFRRLAKQSKKRRKASTTLLFVTDHGTPGKGPLGNKIELWNEQLTVRQLQGMMRPLPRKHRVISVMSQCYSGGFANIMYTRRWSIQGNRCGFFSTLSNREAYGCFPETAKGERVGHAYRIIRAMRDARTYDEAHRATLISDRTPDVPIATSDIFLEDVLRRRARRRRVKPAVEIDRVLRRVWKRPPAYLRSEIRLLGRIQRSFHLKKYRYVSAVWREIKRNRNDLKKIQGLETIWKQVWNEIQRSSLMGFYQSNTRVASTVDREMNRPNVDDQTRRVGKRLYTTYARYVKRKRPVKKRMARLYKRFELVQKQGHLYHTYEAALLRVAMRLTRIAGLYTLRQRGAKRANVLGLRRLMACEQTPIRGRAFRKELRAEGPGKSKSTRRKALARRIPLPRLTPSRLGIGFQPAPQNWHPTFVKTAPGAVTVNEVAPGSPAAAAGLRSGDVIAAIGSRMLKLDSEIRDLVMLAQPNKKLFFMVYRGRRFVTLPVTLRTMNGPMPLQPAQPPQMGMAPQGAGPGGAPGQQDDDSPHGFDADPDTRVFGLQPRQLDRLPQRRGLPPGGVTLRSLSGKKITFPARRGATLLFFWATWCEGCKAMVPMLRRLKRKFRGKGLTILAVTTDSPRMLRPFKRKWGRRFPFKIAIDRGGQLTRRYKISAIPQLLLFSKKGQLVFKNSHLSRAQHRQLVGTIRKYSRQ